MLRRGSIVFGGRVGGVKLLNGGSVLRRSDAGTEALRVEAEVLCCLFSASCDFGRFIFGSYDSASCGKAECWNQPGLATAFFSSASADSKQHYSWFSSTLALQLKTNVLRSSTNVHQYDAPSTSARLYNLRLD